ncbi:uncharacterized protein LOC134819675 isoform X2 [Bolinopsis microptera]|uniref:uncharacterized protein LOC134819675 isoform X2 n=1 Tax=Bolinopsis microptera TaxID=2820187 RepID=UPI00307A2D0B
MSEPTVRGLIHVEIKEAIDLPDTDGFFAGATDAYVKVKLDGAKIAKTSIVEDNTSPIWNQKFVTFINHIGDVLSIEVVDDDIGKNDSIGTHEINFREFVENGGEFEGPVQLMLDGEERGLLEIALRYEPYCNENKNECSRKVPACYFPMRENCRVTLFQDADHTTQPEHEPITTALGESYVPPGAWKQVYEVITNATKFIYITGWAVFTEVVLVREEDADNRTLGEILIEKAEEGCVVFIMIWDEYDDMIPSLVGTHDTDTAEYFEDTRVTVKRCARGCTESGTSGDTMTRLIYSHHQKSIICDSPSINEDDERLRVVAFVGGLDLTDGRYDTPQHPLFSTLLDKHAAHDFYQNCVTVRAEAGPRQPWHDIHSYLEGKIAQDIRRNFEERWSAEDDGSNELNYLDESEYNLEEVYEGDDRWNVQFLRSITSQSCQFSYMERARKLKTERSEKIEDTIHSGYIHHIRRAQNHIFIENQYFLGSAHVWEGDDIPKKATNLIAIELVRNIIEAIKQGCHHSVYCVIPMYPEGIPSSMPVQEILYWQTATMRMMYRYIAQTIEEEGLDTHPTDYLSFYCIGVRGDEIPEDLAEPETDVEIHLREKNRFPIYVHSKMLIADDEYIIVGSANINQRSMSGRRDTEMAVGCYQPNFLCQEGELPSGDVAAFRKSLWVEHMGEMCDEFNDPGSLDCMRKVNEIARSNWEKFVADDFEEPMQGHLLPYPIDVAQDGTVSSLEGFENFPDTDAPVLGTKSNILLEKLTT